MSRAAHTRPGEAADCDELDNQPRNKLRSIYDDSRDEVDIELRQLALSGQHDRADRKHSSSTDDTPDDSGVEDAGRQSSDYDEDMVDEARHHSRVATTSDGPARRLVSGMRALMLGEVDGDVLEVAGRPDLTLPSDGEQTPPSSGNRRLARSDNRNNLERSGFSPRYANDEHALDDEDREDPPDASSAGGRSDVDDEAEEVEAVLGPGFSVQPYPDSTLSVNLEAEVDVEADVEDGDGEDEGDVVGNRLPREGSAYVDTCEDEQDDEVDPDQGDEPDRIEYRLFCEEEDGSRRYFQIQMTSLEEELRTAMGNEIVADEDELLLFIDFLTHLLRLDPKRRLSPADALNHPFLQEPEKINF